MRTTNGSAKPVPALLLVPRNRARAASPQRKVGPHARLRRWTPSVRARSSVPPRRPRRGESSRTGIPLSNHPVSSAVRVSRATRVSFGRRVGGEDAAAAVARVQQVVHRRRPRDQPPGRRDDDGDDSGRALRCGCAFSGSLRSRSSVDGYRDRRAASRRVRRPARDQQPQGNPQPALSAVFRSRSDAGRGEGADRAQCRRDREVQHDGVGQHRRQDDDQAGHQPRSAPASPVRRNRTVPPPQSQDQRKLDEHEAVWCPVEGRDGRGERGDEGAVDGVRPQASTMPTPPEVRLPRMSSVWRAYR